MTDATASWIQQSNTAWHQIQESLKAAEKMLNKAGELIRQEFERIQQAGTFRLPINPEMVRDCDQDWIVALVNLHHEGKLTLPALKKALAEHDDKVRPLMGEADAKVLTAIIEEVDRQVMNQMMEAATTHLKKAEMELSLAKEAREYLRGYRERVHDAYTMGLGADYQAKWRGKYGHASDDRRPEWTFADSPARRGGRKP
ncbi:hypothetical protein [Acidithiobacillus sp.]|uniref:hypothetical protein n=1 Tax=Acidithiobacillus sp. TaxID=1872118 RepID=UPI003D0292F0